ncbi:MAG: fasciclin domain-containing protein [Rhodomicrobium sp.]
MSLALKSSAKNTSDILDTAKYSGTLKTLVTTVNAAGLADMLKGKGPFTIFAPSDEAFEALPAGTLEHLLKSEHRSELVRVLKHHVVSGEIMSDVMRGKRFSRKSLAGIELSIDGNDNIKVNKAHINTADIGASNGVVHVIDAVIMPPKS